MRMSTCKKGYVMKAVEFTEGAFLDLESGRGGKGKKELHYLVEEEDLDLECITCK
jgi:hypothetical protein